MGPNFGKALEQGFIVALLVALVLGGGIVALVAWLV